MEQYFDEMIITDGSKFSYANEVKSLFSNLSSLDAFLSCCVKAAALSLDAAPHSPTRG